MNHLWYENPLPKPINSFMDLKCFYSEQDDAILCKLFRSIMNHPQTDKYKYVALPFSTCMHVLYHHLGFIRNKILIVFNCIDDTETFTWQI